MDTDLRRLLLIATVTTLSLTALIAILALLTQDFGETQLRILATTGGFGLASLIAMRGTALLDQDRQVTLGKTVIGLSALAFLLELWIIWLDTDSEAAWKSYVCATAWAAALGQIAGMLARQRTSDPDSIGPLITGAGTCAVVLALMASFAALAEVDDPFYYELFGVAAVLDVLALALQPVVRRLGQPSPAAPRDRPAVAEGKFAVFLRDGRRLVYPADADLPTAVANSLREHGDRVTRIEFGGG
jgi:hypothetical protein